MRSRPASIDVARSLARRWRASARAWDSTDETRRRVTFRTFVTFGMSRAFCAYSHSRHDDRAVPASLVVCAARAEFPMEFFRRLLARVRSFFERSTRLPLPSVPQRPEAPLAVTYLAPIYR